MSGIIVDTFEINSKPSVKMEAASVVSKNQPNATFLVETENLFSL